MDPIEAPHDTYFGKPKSSSVAGAGWVATVTETLAMLRSAWLKSTCDSADLIVHTGISTVGKEKKQNVRCQVSVIRAVA